MIGAHIDAVVASCIGAVIGALAGLWPYGLAVCSILHGGGGRMRGCAYVRVGVWCVVK